MVIENKILPKHVNIKFEKLTDGKDLAYAKTRHILQDSQGFIWFATDKGLVKYDGLSFKIIDLYREIENVPVENNFCDLHWHRYIVRV